MSTNAIIVYPVTDTANRESVLFSDFAILVKPEECNRINLDEIVPDGTVTGVMGTFLRTISCKFNQAIIPRKLVTDANALLQPKSIVGEGTYGIVIDMIFNSIFKIKDAEYPIECVIKSYKGRYDMALHEVTVNLFLNRFMLEANVFYYAFMYSHFICSASSTGEQIISSKQICDGGTDYKIFSVYEKIEGHTLRKTLLYKLGNLSREMYRSFVVNGLFQIFYAMAMLNTENTRYTHYDLSSENVMVELDDFSMSRYVNHYAIDGKEVTIRLPFRMVIIDQGFASISTRLDDKWHVYASEYQGRTNVAALGYCMPLFDIYKLLSDIYFDLQQLRTEIEETGSEFKHKQILKEIYSIVNYIFSHKNHPTFMTDYLANREQFERNKYRELHIYIAHIQETHPELYEEWKANILSFNYHRVCQIFFSLVKKTEFVVNKSKTTKDSPPVEETA